MSDLLAKLDGARVIEGRLVIPMTGAPHADVTIDKADAIAASGLVLTIADIVMSCSPWRTPIAFQSRTQARLVGGKNGWRNTVAARAYKSAIGVKLSTVLGDAAKECGETISIGTDRALGTHYIRERSPASRHLNSLTGGAWWMALDGTTTLGARPSGTITSPFSLLSYDGARGVAIVATERPGDFVPARTFKPSTLDATLTVLGVVHTLSKGKLRTEVHCS